MIVGGKMMGTHDNSLMYFIMAKKDARWKEQTTGRQKKIGESL
jgi:hypothetical protein